MLPMMGCCSDSGGRRNGWGSCRFHWQRDFFPCRILLFMGKHICACRYASGDVDCRRPQCWQIAVYYAFLGAGTCLVHRAREQRERGKREHGRRAEQKSGGHPGVFPCRTIAACRVRSSAGGEAELDMLDVGQGDGCYLQTRRRVPPVCGRRKFQCRKGGHLSDSAV